MRTQQRFPIHPQTHRGEVLESDLNKHWSRHHDRDALLKQFDDDLKEHTVFMAGHGVSHRKNKPLQVGAVIAGLVATANHNPNRTRRFYQGTGIILLEGYNMSPYMGASKDCAELRALRMGDEVVGRCVEQGQYRLFCDPPRPWKALALFVGSNGHTGINKEVNNIEAPTLHCCLTPCQYVLASHPATSPEMDIISLSFEPKMSIIVAEERFVLDTLRARYAGVESPAVSRELQTQRAAAC